MEKYIFQLNEQNKIFHGDFTSNTFLKHKNEYGEKGADRILQNSQSIFHSIRIMSITNMKNLLLVGKVQSGKTSNLEMITAIAFDNGFNSVIIFGGYDNVLLDQTTQRFNKAFDVSDDSKVHVFTTSDSDGLLNIDQDIIDAIINEDNGKIIFVSMKSVKALSKINSVLNTIKCNDLMTFIIDDEGDQASLNTEFKKMSSSPTYNQICLMKDLLKEPIYFSVTATPQALVFSPQLSRLRPSLSRLIRPGNGYTGAESFHIKEGNIYRIDDSTEDIKNKKLPSSLQEAIDYYFIASAIMRKRGINSSDMIVHCAKEKSIHSSLYTNIENYIMGFRDNIKFNNEDLKIRYKSLNDMFLNADFFSKDSISNYSFDDIWGDICHIVNKVYIVMQNSAGKLTMTNQSLRKYKLFIGGNLLQRGITFKKLVTSYFTRWPKSTGNMDTTLQRARWFGYRLEYLDLCKIFCTKDIAFKYSRLAEIDNDLWDQFESIENDELTIEDIVIDENSTNLRPSRENVVNIKTFSFRKKWFNQSVGTYNIEDTNFNNVTFENLISKLDFLPTQIGRNDEKPSAWYSYIDRKILLDFINSVRTIFSNHPFDKKMIEKESQENNIMIELFWNPKEKDNFRVRKRSFTDDMKVSALQQGADTTDEEKRKYLGDNHVIVDNSAITIQVFRILPILNKKTDLEREQFMFSIHFPRDRKAYQWNK